MSEIKYNEVLDIKLPHCKFLYKEDEQIYKQQLRDRSGNTTDILIDFTPHPSQIR